MISNFKDKASENIFHGIKSKKAVKLLPINLWKVTQRKFDLLNISVFMNDLLIPPNNRLKKLEGDRYHQYSIRINRQYRICFEWGKDEVKNVEIIDYHK